MYSCRPNILYTPSWMFSSCCLVFRFKINHIKSFSRVPHTLLGWGLTMARTWIQMLFQTGQISHILLSCSFQFEDFLRLNALGFIATSLIVSGQGSSRHITTTFASIDQVPLTHFICPWNCGKEYQRQAWTTHQRELPISSRRTLDKVDAHFDFWSTHRARSVYTNTKKYGNILFPQHTYFNSIHNHSATM